MELSVRLPKEFRFDDDFVFIKKSGSVVILIPAKWSWESLIDSFDKFPNDFMSGERDQPAVQQREAF